MNEPLFLLLGIGAILVVALGRLSHSVMLRSLSGAMAFLAIAALTQWGVSFMQRQSLWTEVANVALLLALGFVVARSALVLLFDVVLHRHVGLQVPRLARDVISVVVYFVVAFAILHTFLGLELGTVVATSAVVSVVIGLALQETLGTLLAGLTLTSERRLHTGTWVEVDGVMGAVEELGWRSLALRTTLGERILLPNSQVARTRIKVLGEGREPTAVRVVLSVAYDAPPPAVRETLERAASDIPEVEAEPAPQVGVAELGDNGVVYECRLWTRCPWREHYLKDAFLSRAYAGLTRAGFEMPFPQRTVHLAGRAVVPSPTPRVARALTACPLFTGLPEDAVDALAAASRLQTYFHRESVVRQGEVSRALFVLAAGEATVEVDGQVVATLHPGDVFGEMAFLSGEPRTATARALGNLTVVEVDANALRDLLARHPDLAGELAARMASRQEALAAQTELAKASGGQVSLVGFLRERLLRVLGS